jgi:hypothetical protein
VTRRSSIRALILVVTVLVAAPWPALAASTVRGKLYRQNSGGQSYGASGIPVRLVHKTRGPSARSYSGSDGMFYINNVPPGDYTLEVFTSEKEAAVLLEQAVASDPNFSCTSSRMSASSSTTSIRPVLMHALS